MPKPAGSARTPASRLRRRIVIAVIVVMVTFLAVGLAGFFADPLQLPPDVLEVLDQRASVVSMFIGAAGLIVAVAALLLQLRAERAQDAAASSGPSRAEPAPSPDAPAQEHGASARGGDRAGIASTGDGARNVQMRAQASGQSRVYQAVGDQTIHEGDDQRRTYGGDHIEFHHNTFPGTVIGKQVNTPKPAVPGRDDDGNGDGDDGDDRGRR